MGIPGSFNVISLCAGIGGLDLGVRLAAPRHRTVCYVEREITACEILAKRIEEGILHQAPIWSDLRTFDGKPWRGVVDCVIGGYPCQPFSTMGKRQGEKDPRHLWPEVKRVLEETEAPYLFCENVENHLSLGFFEVATSLREMGYKCEAILLGAAEVGAPHSRNRLFFMAYNEGFDASNGQCQEIPEGVAKTGGRTGGLGGPELPENPFPPGRSFEPWEEILGHDPLSLPAFPHQHDGFSEELARSSTDGLSQIRGLGNAVVPMAAAFAFSILFRWLQMRND